MIGGAVIVVLLPLVAPSTQTASYVFSGFHLSYDITGIQSKPYAVVLSFLVSQYSLYGYDAAAHLTEETKGADRNGPLGIVGAVVVSIFLGWAYILGITFAVTNLPHLLDPKNDTNGYSGAQLFYDAFKNRYGNGTYGILCLGIVAMSNFFCGISSITSNSRSVNFSKTYSFFDVHYQGSLTTPDTM